MHELSLVYARINMLIYLCCEALLQIESLQSEYLIQVQWLNNQSKKFFVKENLYLIVEYYSFTPLHIFLLLQ